MKRDIVFINTHPIQYFVSLYKYLNKKGITAHCWYCSDFSIKENFDSQFNTEIKWDIPLLDGYNYRFFKNFSWKANSSESFFSNINLGMLKSLITLKPSILIIHGWHKLSLVLVLLFARALGHTVCLRSEQPLNQELLKTGVKQKGKKFLLRYLLFPRINYFMYIGSQNKKFYQSYGINDKKLIFCPYSVDNERFSGEWNKLKYRKSEIRSNLGISELAKVIVFSAKYISKKRPMDLLQAFSKMNNRNAWLIMVGEGEMREEMEKYIANNNLDRVLLTGFVNQSKISEYYAIGDLFVMCSEIGETWGLSVNEAMNFELPILVSQLSGCSEDLVLNGDNGFVFTTGDVDDLTSKLDNILFHNALTRSKTSANIIHQFSYETILNNLRLID